MTKASYRHGIRRYHPGIPAMLFLVFILYFVGCSKEHEDPEEIDLTIFIISDQHAQLDHFAQIDYIIDLERQSRNVLVACCGDMFSGNPVVDNHPEKGYPMIDIMNRVGFDISTIGNHEFDYGESSLTDRINQADFKWVCANVDMENTGIPEPLEYSTISIGDLKVTFLGLVETNGKENATIPSTHPWRVQNITFQRPEDVVSKYADLKHKEGSDLYIALTHLGYDGWNGTLGDIQLAMQYPCFDMIIGGHSHRRADTTVNNIPIVHAGSYLNHLGKIELSIEEKRVVSMDFELISMNTFASHDQEIQEIIDDYNDLPYLNEVIGYSHAFHQRYMVGCFYTDALRAVMNTDVSFQNTGGVRSTLDEGDITNREIFEISPFNNGTVIYTMTVSEIKDFLKGSGAGLYYSGVEIEQMGNDILIADLNGQEIPNPARLTVGINDYIPAVHEAYFPEDGEVQSLTAAETLISYLVNIDSQVDYHHCDHYFRFQ